MKKYIIVVLTMSTGYLMAQSATDALRYSHDELNGTARYKAMSGAFGALGGDMSAMAQNPAGSAVFSVGQFGLTLGNSTRKNNAIYFGNSTDSKNSDFSMEQLGSVFVFRNNTPDTNWKKFSLGFNYQMQNSFDNNHLKFSGLNRNHSIINFFGVNAKGFMRKNLETKGNETIADTYRNIGVYGSYEMQQAFLGYQGYLLNPDSSSPDEMSYSSRATIPSNGVLQLQSLEQSGDANKFTFNFGAQYSDNVYLGVNLNSHTVDYTSSKGIIEKDYTRDSDVQYVDFQNELRTTGGGFSLQLGGIVKATKNLRLGVTYNSPTWYTLQDETRQYLDTSAYETSTSTTSNNYLINPDVINVYEKYSLRTPSQWTGSIAYLFGKRGLISLDYIYKGYGNTKFSTESGSYLDDENEYMSNIFADTNSIRIGGEFRATPQFSIRAGYRFEQSPYKDKKLMGDLNGYSFGLGYNFGSLSLDASYDFASQKSEYQAYAVGLTDRASVNSKMGNLLLTLALKL